MLITHHASFPFSSVPACARRDPADPAHAVPVIQHLVFASGLLFKFALLVLMPDVEIAGRHVVGRVREFLAMLLPQGFTPGVLLLLKHAPFLLLLSGHIIRRPVWLAAAISRAAILPPAGIGRFTVRSSARIRLPTVLIERRWLPVG